VGGNGVQNAGGQVRAGALEGSGADAARSMVDMIASMRAFEAGQKVIQTIDETLGKAATQVGAVTGG
jgi:flagellar basal-body rod protein FlgG